MNTHDFIDVKLDELLLKLSQEKNKKVFITGDFNFYLLKTTHTDTSNFYNKIT